VWNFYAKLTPRIMLGPATAVAAGTDTARKER